MKNSSLCVKTTAPRQPLNERGKIECLMNWKVKYILWDPLWIIRKESFFTSIFQYLQIYSHSPLPFHHHSKPLQHSKNGKIMMRVGFSLTLKCTPIKGSCRNKIMAKTSLHHWRISWVIWASSSSKVSREKHQSTEAVVVFSCIRKCFHISCEDEKQGEGTEILVLYCELWTWVVLALLTDNEERDKMLLSVTLESATGSCMLSN